MAYRLIIANKTYSSWSLRPWLALAAADIPFTEELVPLGSDAFQARLAGLGTAGRVPVLIDGEAVVWESLAIISYVAERHPEAGLWPQDPLARAMAQAISAEMHASFGALRNALPMNLARPVEPRPVDAPVRKDVDRICALWTAARARFGGAGPFLFGAFGAADAMYAPVATRLRTYGVALDPVSAAYVDAIHAHPAFVRWREAALQESWVVAEDEIDWPTVKR